MDVELKSLVAKLGKTCHRTLEAAAGLCMSRTHYDVEIEHWLVKLLEEANSDLPKLLDHFDIRAERVLADLTRALDGFKTGNGRHPNLAPSVLDVMQKAWLVGSVDYNLGKIRSGAVLVALARDARYFQRLCEASGEFKKLRVEALKTDFLHVVEGSAEDAESAVVGGGGASATSGDVRPVGKASSTPSLDQFTVDLTAQARAGKIDPVLGRDAEVRQLVDILMRRRQNNPILTGEAGVGKTAVVEGFALRISQGDVPPPLQNVAVRTLDLGLLQAGAGVKGEFENRLKSVIEEVRAAPTPVILFIDEAHNMVGAGGQEGQGDAANLLKPALARGELRTIAATTWAEYKKYFEKDAALSRRFQVVKVEEPSPAVAVTMMRGIKAPLEKHHQVDILEEAIEQSVQLSARYISGRQLPDKSVSLLDTACARVTVGRIAVPPAIEDSRRRISILETETRYLESEHALGAAHDKRLAEIAADIANEKEKLAGLETRWNRERELVELIREKQATLRETLADKENPGWQKMRADVAAAETELKSLQGESPLVQVAVDAQTIAAVVSSWTGVPVGRMLADEIGTVLALDKRLGERVVGQDHALEAITRRIHTSRAKLEDECKPRGVFLLVGPSGVGKTETALALAEMLYGGERNLISINMSEYQESHTVSSLKGSPPGYVGYGEGGVLTEAVRRKPYSVVLLDECEKAHANVMKLFFQVFDKGTLEDGEGREIDFKNTILLLTSNLGTDAIMRVCDKGAHRIDLAELESLIRPELEKHFSPALVGRMVVVPYYPLGDDVLKNIIRLKLNKIVRRVKHNHGVALEYTDAVVDAIRDRCTEVSSGARNVDNILTNTMLPDLSRTFLASLAEGKPAQPIRIDLDEHGAFAYFPIAAAE